MAKPQQSKLSDSYVSYPTASAAAVAALRGMSNSAQYEYGGGILFSKEQNAYAFDPTTSKVSRDTSVGLLGNNRFSNGSTVDETAQAPPTPTLAATPPRATGAPTAPAASVQPHHHEGFCGQALRREVQAQGRPHQINRRMQ